MFKKTVLLAGAFAASTALQPVPQAYASGEGAAAAIGLIGGLIIAAAAQGAASRQACQQ
jgi:hypothetical protein